MIDHRAKLDTLSEIAASKPWYRRVFEFLADAQKLLIGFGSICAGTIAAHAWMAGLVTKDTVHDEVKQAVAEAMMETRGKVMDLEVNTSGLPEWRRGADQKLTSFEERIKANEKLAEKTEARVDRYLVRNR